MKNTAARKLKQVPKGYLIVGVDPHKKKHAAVAITQDFTIHDRTTQNQDRDGKIRLPGSYVRDRDGRPLLAKCGVLP